MRYWIYVPENEWNSVFRHFCVFRRKSPAYRASVSGLVTLEPLGVEGEKAMSSRSIHRFCQMPVPTAGRLRHRQGGATFRHPHQLDCRRLISVPRQSECRAGHAEHPQHHDPKPEGQRTHAVSMLQPSSAAVSTAVDPDREPVSPCGIRTDRSKTKERQIFDQQTIQ